MRGRASQHQILDLPRLVEDIARGSLLVPTCHGPLGWSDEQRLELLRSVRDGLPIGPILIWRTSLRLPVYDHIAGVEVETPRAGPFGYVMDGHQRLAVLFGALRRAEPRRAEGYGRELDWGLWLHAGRSDFSIGVRPDHVLGLASTDLLDSRAVRRRYRDLLARWADPDEVDEFSEAADAVSVAFSRCQVSVVVLETDDEALVLRAMGHAASEPSPVSRRVRPALRKARQRDLRDRPTAPKVSRELAALREEIERLTHRARRSPRRGAASPLLVALLEERLLELLHRRPPPEVAAWVLFLQGRLASLQGDGQSSWRLYQQAVEMNPAEPEFRAALAAIELAKL